MKIGIIYILTKMSPEGWVLKMLTGIKPFLLVGVGWVIFMKD